MRTQNKILSKCEAQIEGQLLPETAKQYEKVVVSGLRVALNKGPLGIMAGLKKSEDPVRDAAVGAINIVMILYKQSGGSMPAEVIPPAANVLMLYGLDFAERIGRVKVTNEELQRATHEFTNHLFEIFKITPEKLNKLAGKVHGVISDPAQLDQVARKAGVVKDPSASVMTTLPEETAQ